MNRSVLTKTLIAALVAAAPLAAQDHDAKFRFGGQLSFASPIGDLQDIASTGVGVSVFGELPMSMNTAIRGRVDYIIFGTKKINYLFSDVEDVVIALDGIYSFNEYDNGFYALVTAGIQRMSWKLSQYAASDSALCYGAGVGYNFNRRFGIEAKYIKGPAIAIKERDGFDFSNNYIQVSVSHRF